MAPNNFLWAAKLNGLHQQFAARAPLSLGLTHFVDGHDHFKPDVKNASTQGGISDALETELYPFLTMQADRELSADVRTALDTAPFDEATNPDEFFAAVHTAAYLTTSCQKLLTTTARLGDIAALLQYDAETAHKWAVQIDGSRTFMSEPPAAVAFQLARAAELKPAPRAAAAWPSAESPCTQRAPSGGRGRGRTSAWAGRNTALAEQRSGPGVDAQARAQ